MVPSGVFDLSQEGSEASDKPGTAEGTIHRPEGFEGKAGSWLTRSKSPSEGGVWLCEKMRSSDCPKGSMFGQSDTAEEDWRMGDHGFFLMFLETFSRNSDCLRRMKLKLELSRKRNCYCGGERA